MRGRFVVRGVNTRREGYSLQPDFSIPPLIAADIGLFVSCEWYGGMKWIFPDKGLCERQE